MSDARDKAADNFFGVRSEGADRYSSVSVTALQRNRQERFSFLSGWDAAMLETLGERSGIDHVRRERDILFAENERLKDELAEKTKYIESGWASSRQWRQLHDGQVDLKLLCMTERDRWIEQAEKLAVALECKGDGYDYKRKEEALADFEAFKDRIKN